MQLAGGSVVAHGLEEQLLRACRRTNELTIAVRLVSANTTQGGPARIVSFSSDPYHRNVTLGQEKDRYVLRLRTPQTGENGSNPQTTLCAVQAGTAQSLVITYRPGRLACFVDGDAVLVSDRVRGDFGNWSPQHFVLGDEWSGERDWAGTLLALRMGSRALPDADARALSGAGQL